MNRYGLDLHLSFAKPLAPITFCIGTLERGLAGIRPLSACKGRDSTPAMRRPGNGIVNA